MPSSITHPPSSQPGLFEERPGSRTVEWLVTFLAGRDWTDSRQLCLLCNLEPNRANRTRFTAIAEASEGRICGHQKGFKLVKSMTGEEYEWWRSEHLKTITAKQKRLVECDRVFYGRKAA